MDSLCTDTGRCRGSGADSRDTLQHTHSHTAPHPTAGRWGTTSPHLGLHTGIHLREGRVSFHELKPNDCAPLLVLLNIWWSGSDLLDSCIKPYFPTTSLHLCLSILARSCLAAFRITVLFFVIWFIYSKLIGLSFFFFTTFSHKRGALLASLLRH